MAQFKTASDMVSDGNFNLQPILLQTSQVRQDEVGRLAEALLLMSDRIHENKLELEEQIQERTEALQDARRLAELQARTDALTGLPNRRAFSELGQYAFDNAKRSKLPISIIMVDIDHFKNINDTYGHAKGDIVLTKIGPALNHILRGSDLYARFGGEEFAILLNDTNREEAIKIAEKVRLAMGEIEINFGETKLHFTASLGVATLSDEHAKLEDLIEDSDTALYRAKREGRNRVMAYE